MKLSVDYTSKARFNMKDLELDRNIIEMGIESIDFSSIKHEAIVTLIDEVILKVIEMQYDEKTNAVDVLSIGDLRDTFVRTNTKTFRYKLR